MKYDDFLKKLDICPFCNLKDNEIVYKNDFGKIILARAPYNKNHILILPHAHVERMSDLHNEVLLGLYTLEMIGVRIISRYHKNFSILYREGSTSNKSIDHLHINIIPEKALTVSQSKIEDREVYSEEEYYKLAGEFRNRISS